MATQRKPMKIRLNLHAWITPTGEIVGGGLEAKSCRGGPLLTGGILETKPLREKLIRAVFDLDRMKPGTQREVTGG